MRKKHGSLCFQTFLQFVLHASLTCNLYSMFIIHTELQVVQNPNKYKFKNKKYKTISALREQRLVYNHSVQFT